MALQVAAPYNPLKITSVGVATPGKNGFATLAKPAPAAAPRAAAPSLPNVYYGGGGGGYSAPAPVYAPKLNIAALNANARAAAEGAVNPYYSKVLNEFLAQQGVKRQQQQTQYDTNIKNLEDSLQQTLQADEQTRGRTTEDVANNQAQINQTAENFQADTGQKFTTDRLAQAKSVASAGLTGGLGAQQQEAAVTARNTDESRQEQDYQKQRDAQALFKGRTFEDLAKADVLKTEETTKGKAQEKFNLDTYIQNQDADTASQRNTLEKARLQDIAQNQQAQSKLAFQRYIAGISNPAQRAAAISTYGGLF
jgi:hypothetical protein